MSGAADRIERCAAAARSGQDATKEARQLIEIVVAVACAAGVVEFAERGVDEIVTVERHHFPTPISRSIVGSPYREKEE